jgi:bacterioferritin (cytochrome b1)
MSDADELWLLSFYRTSEISGALFFGRLARTLRQGRNQMDMTKHFADEAQHARWWTECIDALGEEPLRLPDAYQDQYVAAAGVPANLMEVLALTQVFERRVIGQYARHAKVADLAVPVKETLQRIMQDERWHIEWVGRALSEMEPEFGKEAIDDALQRYTAADQEVYRATITEHADRLDALFHRGEGRA